MAGRRVAALIVALAGLLCVPAGGGIYTWDGGSGIDDNWGRDWNWVGDAKPPNDGTANIHMSGVVRPTPWVDTPWAIQNLYFDAGMSTFALDGSALTLHGTGIRNHDGSPQSIGNVINLTNNTEFEAEDGSLYFGGTISTSGNDLTLMGDYGVTLNGSITGAGEVHKTGAGTAAFSGSSANTVTGKVWVQEGTLALNKTAANGAIDTDLLIGAAGETAVVRLDRDDQIFASASNYVEVNQGGTLDLNGHDDWIGELWMTGGDVTTGAGTLKVTGPILTSGARSSCMWGKLDCRGLTQTIDTVPTHDLLIYAEISNGGVTKTGGGDLWYVGGDPNTYEGTTTVDTGALKLMKSTTNAAIRGDLVINSGGSVELIWGNQIRAGSSTVTVNFGGTLAMGPETDFINNLVMAGGQVTGSGTLGIYGTVSKPAEDNTATISANLDLGGATRTFDIAEGPMDLSRVEVSGVIANGGLRKTGDGTLRLTGDKATAYTGTTYVDGGTLALGKSIADSAVVGRLSIGDGSGADTVRLDADEQISDDAIVAIAEDGVLDLGGCTEKIGKLIMTGGDVIEGELAIAWSPPTGHAHIVSRPASAPEVPRITCTIIEPSNLYWYVDDGPGDVDAEFTGQMPGLGNLEKEGPGTLKLSGPSVSVSRTVHVAEGVLVLARSSPGPAVGWLVVYGTCRLEANEQIPQDGDWPNIMPSGVLDLNGHTQTRDVVLLQGGAVVGGVLRITGTVVGWGSATIAGGALDLTDAERVFEVPSGEVDVSAVITNGAVRKIDDGDLVFSGGYHNTYTGLTTVEEGTLILAKTVADGAVTGNLIVGTGEHADVWAKVRLEQPEQIGASGDTVTVKSDGMIDLNGHAETLEHLKVFGGSAGAGTGALTVSGDLLLDSGTVSVGSLSPGGAFQWRCGTVRVTGAGGLTVGPGGVPSLTLDPAKTLEVTADTIVAAGASLTLAGGTFATGGVELTGGSLIAPAGYDLDAVADVSGHGLLAGEVSGGKTAQIAADGGTLTLGDATSPDGYSHAGTLDIGSNAAILLDADRAQLGMATTLAYGGSLSAPNGMDLPAEWTLSASKMATVDGDFTNGGMVNGPTIPGYYLTFTDDVDGSGTFTGNVEFRGVYSPGTSPAAVSFGSLKLGASAGLAVEIGGLTPGSQHDQLNASGTLSLDGTLDVTLIDGFLPEPGDAFEIIHCGARSGEFADAAGLDDLGGYAGLDFELTYEPDGVELEASAHKGDADLSDEVDVLDLAILANHFGMTGAKWRDANFNDDDEVDVLDLAILANHFGKTTGGGAPIPEPCAAAVILPGLLGLLRRRR